MRTKLRQLIVLATALCVLLAARPLTAGQATTTISVVDDVQLADVNRLGLNIGARNQYSAAQIIKNLIPNPGFESSEFSMIFLIGNHVENVNENVKYIQAEKAFWDTQWNNDPAGIGQPTGFWDGARYEILTGRAAGRSGTVDAFTHQDQLYTFHLSNFGVWPDKLDAVRVSKHFTLADVDSNELSLPSDDVRSGAAGAQSLQLLASPEWKPSYIAYFDSYGQDSDLTAGKLLIVDGAWEFSIWAKAQEAGDTLRARFFRFGGETFMSQDIELSEQWQQYTIDFTVARGLDDTLSLPSRPLAFELIVPPTSGPLWVDDVVLQRSAQHNPTVFSERFVERLSELRPGILRDWGHQFGSSLDNQLASPAARRVTAYAPQVRRATNFHYSLHEFLQLAQYVDAEPWYVIPPTFSREEMQNLAAYFAAEVGEHPYADKRAALGQFEPWTTQFDTIHLEIGNEMWGNNICGEWGCDPFRGATFGGGRRASEYANRRFSQFKESAFYSVDAFNLIIGGQTFYPFQQHNIETNSSNHNTIALAPYFGSLASYSDGDSAADLLYPLFTLPQQLATDAASPVIQSRNYIEAVGQNTELAIYELNFHRGQIQGSGVPADLRNEFVAGQAGALAMPLMMMHYQRELGIRNLVAYQALQFSEPLNNGEFARIFGLLRDTEATGRKRPVWLAIELANQAVFGDMITTQHSGDTPLHVQQAVNGVSAEQELELVQSFAYRDGTRYSLVVYNLQIDQAQMIQVDTADVVQPSATLSLLTANDPFATNEDEQLITLATQPIADFADGYTFSLPPHTMAVIDWQASLPTAVVVDATQVTVPQFSIVWAAATGLLSWTMFELYRRRRRSGKVHKRLC